MRWNRWRFIQRKVWRAAHQSYLAKRRQRALDHLWEMYVAAPTYREARHLFFIWAMASMRTSA